MRAETDGATIDLGRRLGLAKVLPVVRAESAFSAAAMCERVYDAGLRVVELTTTIPDWPAALAELQANFPDVTTGVGTVTNPSDALRAIDGGAKFLVSPCRAEHVRTVADDGGVPFLEGGLTPSEVLASAGHGIAKLFPAHVGGPALLRDILTVSPGSRVVPTGGIRLGAIGDWLGAGALAVGVGSDLWASGDLREQLERLSGGDGGR